MTQETLEEAALNYVKSKWGLVIYPDIEIAFKAGANWQAKQIYSEEEVEEIFKQAQLCSVKSDGVYFKYESFKQFKKK